MVVLAAVPSLFFFFLLPGVKALVSKLLFLFQTHLSFKYIFSLQLFPEALWDFYFPQSLGTLRATCQFLFPASLNSGLSSVWELPSLPVLGNFGRVPLFFHSAGGRCDKIVGRWC